MWILPKNCEPFPSAQDMLVSSEDSNLAAELLSHCVTWNGRATSSLTYSKRLSTVGWLLPLYSRMLKPSLHGIFMVKWTSSRVDTLVNLSRQRERDSEKTTHDTSGLSSSTTSKQCDHDECSSRTSKDISATVSNKSCKTWETQVIEQRGEYSRRMKWAEATGESGSLSWATPNTMDHLGQRTDEGVIRQATGARKGRKRPANLREQVNARACAIYNAINGDGSMDNLPPRTPAMLNPVFLEQLMGLKTGSTGLGSWETE